MMVEFLQIVTLGIVLPKIFFHYHALELLTHQELFFHMYLWADDAFPLRHNMVKPYAETNLDIRKLVANYRISRARRVIENSFGILAARFRVFRRPIHAKLDATESITKACVALHNFLMAGRQYGTEHYCPDGFADYEINGKNLMGNGEKLFMVIQALLQLKMLVQIIMERKQKMCVIVLQNISVPLLVKFLAVANVCS